MRLYIDQSTYGKLLRGYTNKQIAADSGCTIGAAELRVTKSLNTLGLKRTEAILLFVRNHYCDNELPRSEYHQALCQVTRLSRFEQRTLAMALKCWLDYINGMQPQPPNQASIAGALGHKPHDTSAQRFIQTAAKKWNLLPVHAYQLLRIFYMAGQRVLKECQDTHVLQALHKAFAAKRPGRYKVLRWPAFHQSTPLALGFVDAHCPDDTLPLTAYRKAFNVVQRLTRADRRLLAVCLEQWQLHISGKADAPSTSSYAKQLGATAMAITVRLTNTAKRFGYPGISGHSAELVATYYMAILYPILCLDE